MEERACQLALYLIENRATVRSAARKFGVSKSTVHKDLSERLPAYNRALYLQVKEVLDGRINEAEGLRLCRRPSACLAAGAYRVPSTTNPVNPAFFRRSSIFSALAGPAGQTQPCMHHTPCRGHCSKTSWSLGLI